MTHFHKLVVLWMLSTTVHLPVPVCDGDNLRSGEPRSAESLLSHQFDIDFIFLGCDLPDDVDDGPVDDDPENVSNSPFGSISIRANATSIAHSGVHHPIKNAFIANTRNLEGVISIIQRLSANASASDFSVQGKSRVGVVPMRC